MAGYELTQDSLQRIAVGCVTQFLAKQASLNEAVADKAIELELNPDQIKRVVETTNTLAYLRQLPEMSDRTFEFPLASYPEVLGSMSKTAEELPAKDIPVANEVVSPFNALEAAKSKDAAVKDESEEKGNLQEKVASLQREYLRGAENLEKMAYDKEIMVQSLLTSAAKLAKDPLAMEKLAYVVDSEDFTKMTNLCKLEKSAQVNDAVFTDKDLALAEDTYALYKRASGLVEQEKDLKEFLTKSASILGRLGQAGQAVLGAGASAARKVVQAPFAAVGWGVKKTVQGAGSMAGGAVHGFQNSRKFSSAATEAGYKSTKDAIKGYDKIRFSQGDVAAKAAFKGAKPGTLARVGGLTAVAGFAGNVMAGASIKHDQDVWNTLHN